MRNKILVLAVVLLCITISSSSAKPYYTTIKEGAIRGYDPVAYFSQSEAKKGSDEFAYEWEGVVWYFVSEENLQAFQENPQKYAPQYGGFCAYAVVNGQVAVSDPNAWSIHNEKLYLNFNQQVKNIWLLNKEEYILNADRNWQERVADLIQSKQDAHEED